MFLLGCEGHHQGFWKEGQVMFHPCVWLCIWRRKKQAPCWLSSDGLFPSCPLGFAHDSRACASVYGNSGPHPLQLQDKHLKRWLKTYRGRSAYSRPWKGGPRIFLKNWPPHASNPAKTWGSQLQKKRWYKKWAKDGNEEHWERGV